MLQETNRRKQFTAIPVIACICLSAWMACAQASGSGAAHKGAAMQGHASGSFDVKLSPQDDKSGDAALGRMTIDKQFHGDLDATSQGQMLSAVTETKGSAGYVAIEKVSGKLNGRTGTFVLQHNATMTRGEPYLNIIVVPDSGTGELTGLTGKMTIRIEGGGKHFYDFEYTLPEKQ
jgi:hypothetical protein